MPDQDGSNQNAPTNQEKLSAALDYLSRGWWVFPEVPGQRKSYLSKDDPRSGGQPWGMTNEKSRVAAYFFSMFTAANVAVVTGAISGIFVVETDTIAGGHAADGATTLAALEQANGRLPETLMCISPSGSVHRYFQHPGDHGVANSASVVGPGIDIRGDGGMVLAPPSTHRRGGVYRWLNEGVAVAPAPLWLLALVRKRGEERDDVEGGGWLGEPVDRELIELALSVIPNNDEVSFDAWLKIGFSIFAGCGGEQWGFELFDKWSAQWVRYDAAITRKTWNNFHKAPPQRVTVGTLFYLAEKCRSDWRVEYDLSKQVPIPVGFESDDEKQFVGDGSEQLKPGTIPPHTIIHDNGTTTKVAGTDDAFDEPTPLSLRDFVSYMPNHTYIFKPTQDMWPAVSVNACIKLDIFKPTLTKTGKVSKRRMAAAEWLDNNKRVEQITWAPGYPEDITGMLVHSGGWIPKPGAAIFNTYKPPLLKAAAEANADDVAPWRDHLIRLYGDHAYHILSWFAHRVQWPGEKINHALVLGGSPGIGKDTILEPLRQAVGSWNFNEVSPKEVLGRFNEFRKSVVLRINEGHDLGEFDRYKFYDCCKAITAAPPETLRIDSKNIREYMIPNVVGVIITTNHRIDGIYLPADDRRHYVVWSEFNSTWFPPEYWDKIWNWYNNGGMALIRRYLLNYDLSGFNVKEPPPKTEVFKEIADAGRAPEEDELTAVLTNMKWPVAVTIEEVARAAQEIDYEFGNWLLDRRNAKKVPFKLDACDYHKFRNPDEKIGNWPMGKKHRAVYAKKGALVNEVRKRIHQLQVDAEREARGWTVHDGDKDDKNNK